VQVVEVDHVVVDELGAGDHIADKPRIRGDGDAQRRFDGPD
jgi:hypothetical protein